MHKIVGKLIQHNLVLLYFIDTILYIKMRISTAVLLFGTCLTLPIIDCKCIFKLSFNNCEELFLICPHTLYCLVNTHIYIYIIVRYWN